jgi:hypothetical protein
MKIKTNRPVYSYAEGDKGEFIKKFGEKFKEWKDSGKLKEVGSTLGQIGQSGILQGWRERRQARKAQRSMPPTQPMAPMPPPPPEKQGMSQTTKILIGVGAGALILGLIYFASKKNTTIITQPK